MEKKILWASRHALDQLAEETLILMYTYEDEETAPIMPSIEKQEILWPASLQSCELLADELLFKYDALAGVWPAQAVEALIMRADAKWTEVHIVSPVSVPETEPDVRKVRPFRFVRWARIWPIIQ